MATSATACPSSIAAFPALPNSVPARRPARSYDGVVVIECNGSRRAPASRDIDGLFSINIDHHETFVEYADVNYVITSAAAAAELVYHVAVAAGVAITPDIATSLYTAVLTDTGSFCYS